jgi:hypothetical protein
MIPKRIRRRPSAIRFIREVHEPLIDDVVRPIRQVLLDVLDRHHRTMFSASTTERSR